MPGRSSLSRAAGGKFLDLVEAVFQGGLTENSARNDIRSAGWNDHAAVLLRAACDRTGKGSNIDF